MNIQERFHNILEAELITEIEQVEGITCTGDVILDIGQTIRAIPIISDGSVKSHEYRSNR